MGWLRQLFTRRHRYNELSESIREHLEEKIADLTDHGMTREQAEQAARRDFGNVTVIEERSREVWQWPTLESLWADTKYALRRLRKTPRFTTIALLTLALGIGANTGIFTLLDAVLLKSLPLPNPEQLFIVKQSGHPADKSRFSYPFFDRVGQRLPYAASIAAMGWPDDFYVSIGSEQPQLEQGQLVSGNYFQVFETYPVLGRLLTPADDEKIGGSPVAVISYGYWQSQFGGDPAVVGRKLEVNRVPVTIIGVAPRGLFRRPCRNAARVLDATDYAVCCAVSRPLQRLWCTTAEALDSAGQYQLAIAGRAGQISRCSSSVNDCPE